MPTVKMQLILLSWVRPANNHLLILITKQTKWKTAFKTGCREWDLVHRSQIIACMSVPIRRTRDVLGYGHLRLTHESQKERLLHMDS